jgi:hypothetical protein
MVDFFAERSGDMGVLRKLHMRCVEAVVRVLGR